jgi:hypothetical protein
MSNPAHRASAMTPNPLLLRTGHRHCANANIIAARRRTTRSPDRNRWGERGPQLRTAGSTACGGRTRG